MARVLITYDGGDVPIVTGGVPPNDTTPIDQPTDTGFVTNQEFITDDGEYCFGLQTTGRVRPLWRVVQTVAGTLVQASFHKVSP